MLGYGRTSSPDDPDEYTYKKISHHLKCLVHTVCGPESRVILGGHDWGAILVWRIAMWQPDMVLGIFSLNGPYFAPDPPPFLELEDLVRRIPTIRYQIQLASDEGARIVDASPGNLRSFLNAVYDGICPSGEEAFTVDVGIHEELLGQVGPAQLMSSSWVEFYAREFERNGFRGPTNWYRARRANFEDELELVSEVPALDFVFKIPAMIVMGGKDEAVPVELADGMDKFFERPLRKEVVQDGGHWAHWQYPEMTNMYIGSFLKSYFV